MDLFYAIGSENLWDSVAPTWDMRNVEYPWVLWIKCLVLVQDTEYREEELEEEQQREERALFHNAVERVFCYHNNLC